MADKPKKLLWPDEEDWLDTFRKYLCGHPELAEHVAHIWFALLEHLSQGPEGIRDARSILKQALRLTYPFTASCRLAYRHYKLSLSGQVKPMDEPSILLRDSIERARAQIAEARTKKPATKAKSAANAKEVEGDPGSARILRAAPQPQKRRKRG